MGTLFPLRGFCSNRGNVNWDRISMFVIVEYYAPHIQFLLAREHLYDAGEEEGGHSEYPLRHPMQRHTTRGREAVKGGKHSTTLFFLPRSRQPPRHDYRLPITDAFYAPLVYTHTPRGNRPPPQHAQTQVFYGIGIYSEAMGDWLGRYPG